MSKISTAVESYIKTSDSVELAQSLKHAFYEKLGQNEDFSKFSQDMEKYKEPESKPNKD